MDAGKNAKDASPSHSQTPEEQRSPQRTETSTQMPPSDSMPHSSPPPPGSYPSPRQGGPSLGGSLGGIGGTAPAGIHAIAVGGNAGDVIGSAGGIVLDATGRKRIRDASEGLVAGGGGNLFECRICGRGFATNKSLFGHMRSHRERSWKGAFPPPAFSRQEFADTGLLNPEEAQGVQEAEQVAQEATPTVEEVVAERVEETGNLNVVQPQALDQGQVQYRVPDLNLPPSEEDSGSGNRNDN